MLVNSPICKRIHPIEFLVSYDFIALEKSGSPIIRRIHPMDSPNYRRRTSKPRQR